MSTARAAGGFWGHSPEAPLDLGDLDLDSYESISGRLADKTMPALAEAIARVGNCSHPVRLRGRAQTVDEQTGELVDLFTSADMPLGVLFKACGNRREDVCPACSRLYARDTFEVVSTGLHGGKGVPDSVAANPLLFVTLTAPSFGDVHAVVTDDDGRHLPCHPRSRAGVCEHGRPRACWVRHHDGDDLAGAPLCDDCYDVVTAAIWQWFAPELWGRFTTAVRRALASRLHLSDSALRRAARLEFVKVAEFQARGAVHFHALIRLDGPDGPGSPAPADADTLAAAVKQAAAAAWLPAPPVDDHDVVRVLRFGEQADVKQVRHGNANRDELRASQVGGYIAKYATKSAGLDAGKMPASHLARLAHTCRALAERALSGCPNGCARTAGQRHPELCEDCQANRYALLGKWSRMLGFRGHFSTKSRRYSVTLGALRRARRRFQQYAADAQRRGEVLDTHDLEARLMADDDEETTLVTGSWTYQGTGWQQPGDKALADAAAARAREHAKWKAARAA